MKRDEIPFDLGPVHFVGIGGIGMSSIAEIMIRQGYTVQGSDMKASANTERLEKLGARVFVGHAAENVDGASALVVSTAIKPDNPELQIARASRIPVVHAGLDPTVVNGGIIDAYKSNAKIGSGQWMAVEADESDGSFLKFPATAVIVTNIDPEHLEHYGGSFDTLRDAFYQFVENLPFYGFAVLCIDHPEVRRLAERVENRRVITYGRSQDAQVRVSGEHAAPSGTTFDLEFAIPGQPRKRWSDIVLPMMGEHNVLNACAALITAREIGLEEAAGKTALAGFGGVKRRFTVTGKWEGATIVDDYGHHPVEIEAVLKAARQASTGKVIAIMQPHRYTRLRDLFDDFAACFAEADSVLIADVYAAGEGHLAGFDRDHLVAAIAKNGKSDVTGVTRESVAAEVARRAGEGDVVVCLGAGDITQWAYDLPGELEALG